MNFRVLGVFMAFSRISDALDGSFPRPGGLLLRCFCIVGVFDANRDTSLCLLISIEVCNSVVSITVSQSFGKFHLILDGNNIICQCDSFLLVTHGLSRLQLSVTGSGGTIDMSVDLLRHHEMLVCLVEIEESILFSIRM